MTAFNKLTHAQAERLALLIQESGEVIQAATKILIHGYDSSNPFDSDHITNREQLQEEIGHFVNAMSMLGVSKDIDLDECEKHTERKRISVSKWLHHNDITE